MQDHVEDVAQARSCRDESARVELRAFEAERYFRPALPAVLRVRGDRGPRQVADDIAGGGAPGRDRQLRANAERAVALGIERQRAGRRPAEEAHEARPPQADAAVEYRRLGRTGDDALQLAAAAARQAEAQLLDLELVVRAGERQAQPADGLAADVGLVDREGRARAALGRQQIAQADGQGNDAVERARVLARSGDAVEIEPARREAHLHREGVPPQGPQLAGDELGSPVLLERQARGR